MPKRNFILFAALAGLAGFLCMFAGLSIGLGVLDPNREAEMDPGAVRRQAVENSMSAVLPAELETGNDPDLAGAAAQLAAEKYIVWVWVMDTEGIISFVRGGPARVGDSVYDMSAYETDLILGMEPALLSPAVESELRLTAALRREGEHNDIYRHLVRSVPGPDGKPAAFVGVAYDAVDSTPGVTDIAFLLLGAAGFLLYWLGLPLWVFLDARAGGTGRAAILWGLFVLIANAAGLLAYLLVRHRSG